MPRLKLTPQLMEDLPETHSEIIPADYLDEMGHMNVRWYTHLFSCASAGFMEQIGLSWDKIAEQRGGTFVLESHTRFFSEVHVGQAVRLYARLIARSEKRYQLLQLMTNQDKQDISATSEIIVAHVDLESRRQAPLPEQVKLALDQLLQTHSQLSWPAPVCGVMAP